jgi:hypothetical protein
MTLPGEISMTLDTALGVNSRHVQLCSNALSRSGAPLLDTGPLMSGTSRCAKALVRAFAVGAGGVEPPSSSVSDPASYCRPVCRRDNRS